MKPVLAKLPPEKRTLYFVPAALGAFVLAFLVLAILTPDIYYPIVLSLPLAIAAAWALLGWPVLTHKDGRPLVDPKVKPYLFFPLAFFLSLLAYTVVGVPLTRSGLSLNVVTYLSIALAFGIGCTLAYFAVGFPTPHKQLPALYRQIPAERRRHFFWPLWVVFFLVLYVGLGALTTSYLDALPGGTAQGLDLQPLILLPLCLILSGLLAYLLVGIPTPKHNPVQYVQKVGGKARPRLFFATTLLLGIPLTAIVGAVLTEFAKTDAKSRAFLPAEAVLPIALLLGFAAAAGLAAALWGTPARWRRYEDYSPGLPPRARLPVLVLVGVVAGLVVTAAFGAAGLDIFYGLLAGFFVGAFVALWLTGALKRFWGRREEGFAQGVTDRQKPLILFPVWFGVAFLLFATLTYALPDLVAVNLLGGLFVGLVVALALLETRLLRDVLRERREARERRKQWKALRKQRLREAEEGADAKPDAR